MTELVLAMADHLTGRLIVEQDTAIGRAVVSELGPAEPLGCARPREVLRPEPSPGDTSTAARIAGVWHDSLIEGPGRRSVVQFQGCPIRCKGCWVPETWDERGGYEIGTARLAEVLLDPDHERDGVTIIGGEPFAQPAALLALVAQLRLRQPSVHITVYSGFTYEALMRKPDPRILTILRGVNLLIDGPYVAGLEDQAGAWTGSGNQRVIPLR